jgi:ribonuclease HII
MESASFRSVSGVRIQPDLTLERRLWARGIDGVAGVDEVGVGALAGPVVAAAVIIRPGISIEGLADSKLLTAKRRKALFVVIRECAIAIGLGRTEVEEVDRMNVYWAAMEARRRAVEALTAVPAHVLVDGKRRIAGCGLAQTAVVEGDARCASIAAASVVAKVTRDSLMMQYSWLYTEYGFERHKGYATATHLAALARLGPLVVHRRSCMPVRRAAGLEPQLQFWSDQCQSRRQDTNQDRSAV